MLDGPADSPTFRDAPIFLKEELTFPYRYGMDFTLKLEKAGGKEQAFAGAFKDPPKTTREIMEPETYLAHEKLDPVKRIDFKKDLGAYDAFDIGAMGEFDVDVLVEQYAGREGSRSDLSRVARRLLLRGPRERNEVRPARSALCFALVESGQGRGIWAVYAKSLAQRYQKRQALGPDGKVASRCSTRRFLAHIARTPCLDDRRRSRGHRRSRRFRARERKYG